jgi:hypothetical protein
LSTGPGRFSRSSGSTTGASGRRFPRSLDREIEDCIEEGSLLFGFVQTYPNEAREEMI